MTAESGAIQVYRGRAWLALYLLLMAPLCLCLAAATVMLDWSAVLLMGSPSLFAAYVCLTYGWGEAVARVELRSDGFSLRLPRYRGYFPFWPVRRLSGAWNDVTAIRRYRVRATFVVPYDYIAHVFETRDGSITLLEPLPNDLSNDPRKSGLNLPARRIVSEFAMRVRHSPRDEGEISGGGLWRNLLFGGPDLSRRRSLSGA